MNILKQLKNDGFDYKHCRNDVFTTNFIAIYFDDGKVYKIYNRNMKYILTIHLERNTIDSPFFDSNTYNLQSYRDTPLTFRIVQSLKKPIIINKDITVSGNPCCDIYCSGTITIDLYHWNRTDIIDVSNLHAQVIDICRVNTMEGCNNDVITIYDFNGKDPLPTNILQLFPNLLLVVSYRDIPIDELLLHVVICFDYRIIRYNKNHRLYPMIKNIDFGNKRAPNANDISRTIIDIRNKYIKRTLIKNANSNI